MKKTLLLATVMLASLFAFSQDDPKITGYYLRPDTNIIKVYQSNPNDPDKPDLTNFNFWNLRHHYNYWFKKSDIKCVEGGITFIRITIPSTKRWDPDLKKFVDSPNYNHPKAWKEEERGDDIDSQDFNSWLWISEEDFKQNNVPFYGHNVSFQISAITTPFKYRFATGNHASSIQNSDLNLGTFAGFRIGNHTNTNGFNLGVILGVSSTTMNSANNSLIADKNTSQSNVGVNYGAAAVFDIHKQFQIGVIAGWDHATGDVGPGYIYQDRMWVGFSLNFKFLSFGGGDAAQSSSEEH